ncbi:hypothetical protein OD91_0650 [Lutibacter sp. Hel_I_33_5]|nr:hypothetical protein OD91_0650 [Lutibacter sp. Hel_I_33_5]
MKQIKLEKTILLINVIATLYFIALILISFYPIENNSFNVIAHTITIPSLLFMAFSLGYSTYRLLKNKINKKIILIFFFSLQAITVIISVILIQMSLRSKNLLNLIV